MPRRRKKKSAPPQEDYRSAGESEMPDSGEVFETDQAPDQPIGADDDELVEDDDNLDPWGAPSLESQLPKKPASADPRKAASEPPPDLMSRPALSAVKFNDEGYLQHPPVTKMNLSDETRYELSWVVQELKVGLVNSNQPTATISVKAMLCLCKYELVPIGQGERREPVLTTQPLFEEPVTVNVPVWLLPPELARNPNKLTLEMAETVLAQLFTSFPTEIIRPAPPPAAAERLPDWLKEKIMKGEA